MTDYDNTGRGALFKNENKNPDSNQPDYSGNITTMDGQEKRLAAWIKTARSGKVFMSLQMSEFQEKRSEPAAEKPNGHTDDEIPF